MALLPPSIDYTSKDFDALRARLIALVQSTFPEWSDFSVAGFGNLLLELYAFVGDVVTFYLDNQARESRLATATQRKNVIALARMLGYELHGAQAATAEVVFTLARPPTADVLLAAGTVVRTQEVTEPVRFQLLADVLIRTGQAPPVATGVVEHSRTHTQRFDARGLADLDVALDHAPYLDGSALVSAGNGVYTEVDSFLDSGPHDRHFLVLVDQNDRATVRFGNGRNGAPPAGTICITYKTGGGAGGNVDAARLVVVEGVFADAHGRPVQVAATNPAPASGGTDRQSVARALMLTANEDPTIAENSGVLYVIPAGGGKPTPALVNAVRRQVTEVYPCMLTFQVSVQAPVYKIIHVEARIYLRQGHAGAAVRDRVRANLQAMFRLTEPDGTPNPRVGFGFHSKDVHGNPAGEVAWSDVFDVIRDTEGVRKLGDRHGDLALNGLPADVKLRIQEFPLLGTVALVDGDTGAYL